MTRFIIIGVVSFFFLVFVAIWGDVAAVIQYVVPVSVEKARQRSDFIFSIWFGIVRRVRRGTFLDLENFLMNVDFL